MNILFSSESVSETSDKIADQIADAILDEFRKDPVRPSEVFVTRACHHRRKVRSTHG